MECPLPPPWERFRVPCEAQEPGSRHLLLIQPQSLRRAPERATATFAPEIATTTSAAKAACILSVWLCQPVQSCGYFLHCCCCSVLSLLLLTSCYQLCLLYWQQAGKEQSRGEEGTLIGPNVASKASKNSKRGCFLADSLNEPEQPAIAWKGVLRLFFLDQSQWWIWTNHSLVS